MTQHTGLLPRVALGLTAALLATSTFAQVGPVGADAKNDGVQRSPSDETPVRQPTVATDVNGKSIPATEEKLVLADPESKMYMPCRDPNESKSTDDSSSTVKLNPKAAVLSEEAAKQHGYKPSPHKVVCPKK
ncbi:MAG: hypothetical protein EOP08_01450 [Proteobacteria bacterium]|nr:MAG: hypothetical protein EOP08_01450 [Pseudomonadota bacterium]